MLISIEQIDGLGVFEQYAKPEDLRDFSRFNLIYGMNGSGKTTLSRLLSYLYAGSSDGYPDLKYRIRCEEGQFREAQPYPCKIRVFNSDYVDLNIGEIEGQLNPIFIVGEENKSLVAQIQSDEQALAALEDEKRAKQAGIEKLEKDRGKLFTDVARLIAADTSGQVTRNYRKPDAERAFVSMSSSEILDEGELDTNRKTVRQTSLDLIEEVICFPVKTETDGAEVPLFVAINRISERARELCSETSDSQAIERLRENTDLAAWVEEGMTLHAKHTSTNCEYCSQPIPEARLIALGRHFNQSDQDLRQKLDETIAGIKIVRESLNSITLPTRAQFYDELRTEYQSASNDFRKARSTLDRYLVQIGDCLTVKLGRRTEEISYDAQPFETGEIVAALEIANAAIRTHNEKSNAFEERVETARAALERHHLSSVKEPVSRLDEEISEMKDRLIIVESGNAGTGDIGIDGLRSRIAELRLKVSNSEKAAAELTDLLQIFLGRNDLKFEREGDGYRIIRHGAVAKRLSEGEKTAIAFIYFIVQLRDQDFNLEDGIVVIDDPVSSLDSGSLYQAFSFLKNSVKRAKQVFLMTHSFDFMKLLLNWYKNIPRAEGEKSYYMVLCGLDGAGQRRAVVEPLDKELLWNENEYAFLFKQLYRFESNGTIAGSYHIPNIARKVLESFLDFYYPGSESMYRKLEKVSFDENKKTALLKFANDLSHPTGKGFDPALVPETQKNVKYLLEMIKTVSPIHYASQKASIDAG